MRKKRHQVYPQKTGGFGRVKRNAPCGAFQAPLVWQLKPVAAGQASIAIRRNVQRPRIGGQLLARFRVHSQILQIVPPHENLEPLAPIES